MMRGPKPQETANEDLELQTFSKELKKMIIIEVEEVVEGCRKNPEEGMVAILGFLVTDPVQIVEQEVVESAN